MGTQPAREPASREVDKAAVTLLLKRLSGGDQNAFDRLVPLVYDQLRRLASRSLRAGRPEQTLRATALVHEAYLRLAGADGDWQDRAHFFAVAARVMRNILVDHARAGARQKRGGGAQHIALDEAVVFGPAPTPELADLDESLRRLEMHDARKAKVVELLFFGGLTYEETAAAIGISEATVHRELKMAKAWLYRDLSLPVA
ncbi:MAG TPA: sigma-70 family RNA polymerase sigma factor [Bryobacteraceae bacterium]|jgi:RNA polymerase sigma factor (TIGR02999 family)